jgi:GAF domain-containing protein
MLDSLSKDRARLEQRVVDLEERIGNMEQWERRYLDVIENLTRDSNEALKESLRTYDGRLE